MRRYDCLQVLASTLDDDALVITNLGHTGFEWADLRPSDGNLYSMGMGLVTPTALGVALAQPDTEVVALDGDGSLLLSLGALATVGWQAPPNLTVVVFDNATYASTGPQPTATAGGCDLAAVGAACGIDPAGRVTSTDAFAKELAGGAGRCSLVVAVVEASSVDVGPKLLDGKENKYAFVRHVERQLGRPVLQLSRLANPHARRPPDRPPADATVAGEVLAGLRAAGIGLIASLPATQLDDTLRAVDADEGFAHVRVSNEAEGAAVCAGSWLAGTPGALLVESSGVIVASYALSRCHGTFGIPTVVVSTYRGDYGESEWYAVGTGGALHGVLDAVKVPNRVVNRLDEVRSTVFGAAQLAESSLWPTSVTLGRALTTRGRDLATDPSMGTTAEGR